MPRRIRLKVGDVFEIPTSAGLAYAQSTHNHRDPPVYGWYFRVLPGQFSKRPADIAALVGQREQFGCFCDDVRRHERIGNWPVPEFAAPFPLFKRNLNPAPPDETLWYLWNGGECHLCRRLPQKAVAAPLEELIDEIVLIDRIQTGWHSASMVRPVHIDPDAVEVDLERYPTEEAYWEFYRQFEGRPVPLNMLEWATQNGA